MPCVLGGTNKISKSTAHIQGNRLDLHVRKPVLHSPEERCVILILLSVGRDSYWKLAPFLPDIQEAKERSCLTSGAPSDTESLELPSPSPAILHWSGLLNENNISMHYQTDSVKPFPNGTTLGGNASRQPRNRKKFNKSSTAFPCYVVSDKPSRLVSDPLKAGSDCLVDDLTKTNKTSKRSPRKKGKKKGKQYRQATYKKPNVASEIPREDNIDVASPLEPQNNLLGKSSVTSSSASSLVNEAHFDNDDSENNNEYVDCQTMLNSSTSVTDNTDDSEPTVSSHETVCEGFSCNGVAYLNDGLNAIDASEVDGSTFIKHGYFCSREESSSCHKSWGSSVCNSKSAKLDSFFDGWNSDISWNYSDDVESRSIKDENRCDHSRYGVSTDMNDLGEVYHLKGAHLSGTCAEDSNDSFVDGCSCSQDIGNSSNCIERVQCSSEACSSNTVFLASSGRRGRRSRKASSYGNLNMSNRAVGANNHNRSGKDSSLSVWQKVEKLDYKQCKSKAGHVSATPLQDKSALEDFKRGVKPDPSRQVKQNQSRKACGQASPDEAVKLDPTKGESDALNSCGVFFRSPHKKQIVYQQSSSSSKQATRQSSKNCYPAKNKMSMVPKKHSQQKGGLPMLELVNVKDTNSGSLSPSATSLKLLLPPTEIGSNNLVQEKGGSQSVIKAAPGFCSLDSDWVQKNAFEEAGSSTLRQDPCALSIDSKPISISSSGSANLCTDPCAAAMEENQSVKLVTENSSREPCKLDSDAGRVFQKWVPVGKRVISGMIHLDVSDVPAVEAPANYSSNCANTEVPRDISDVSSSTGGQLTLALAPQCAERLCPEGSKIDCMETAEPYSPGQIDGLNCQASIKTKTDLYKITEAVSDAHRAQQRAEDIQSVIGRPLADVERFIYSASPVVHLSPCNSNYNSSSQERISDDLYSHQIPDVCLKRIWQWYEEPSYYGVNVKAQDFRRSKSVRKSNCKFTAYFVPYLSAVQLFGQPYNTNLGCPNEEAAKMGTSKPSLCLNPLPILASLLPQQSNQRSGSLSVCTEDDQLLENTKVIFEFFESEQPSWRRPLFDKVNELIGGVEPLKCQISGDPKNLELRLHDLHPASWYCVAWYPVYRVPDGKFRAAFLTYHSLGRWIHRSSSSDNAGRAHVVFPVVGLLSYNDKGEQWFQMTCPDSDIVVPTKSLLGSPSQVMRESLQTLNHTAATMARANILKHGQMCRNTHPDYEFFLSRYQ